MCKVNSSIDLLIEKRDASARFGVGKRCGVHEICALFIFCCWVWRDTVVLILHWSNVISEMCFWDELRCWWSPCIEKRPGALVFQKQTHPPQPSSPAAWPWRQVGQSDPAESSPADRTCLPHWRALRIRLQHVYLSNKRRIRWSEEKKGRHKRRNIYYIIIWIYLIYISAQNLYWHYCHLGNKYTNFK